MSDLTEKVRAAIAAVPYIKKRNRFDYDPDLEGEARAAIKAVAEWLDAHHKAEYLQSENHASPALRAASEGEAT